MTKKIFVVLIICIALYISGIYCYNIFKEYKKEQQFYEICQNQDYDKLTQILEQYNLDSNKTIDIFDQNSTEILCQFVYISKEIRQSYKTGNISKLDNLIKQNIDILNTNLGNEQIKLIDLFVAFASLNEFNPNLLKIIEVLLQNGAKVNYFMPREFYPFTPLQAIFVLSDTKNDNKNKIADLFIKYGADINLTKEDYYSLRLATSKDDMNMFEYFLIHKIDTKNKLWQSLDIFSATLYNNYALINYIFPDSPQGKLQDKISDKIINSKDFKSKQTKMTKYLKIFVKYNDLSNQDDKNLERIIRDIVFANNIEAVKILLNLNSPQKEKIVYGIKEYAKIYNRNEITNLIKG